MITKLKDFDAVYVLSYDKRYYTYTVSLKAEMKRRFDVDLKCFIAGDGNILPREMYNFIDRHDLPPIYGDNVHSLNTCLCFLEIMKDARDKGYKNIVFMEDDAFYYREFEEKLALLGPQLDSMDWNVLYFGYSTPFRMDLYNPQPTHWEAVSHAGGFHASAVNRAAIEKLASLKPEMNGDCLVQHYIDKRFVMVNQAANQYPSYSYAHKMFIKRETDVWEELEKIKADGAILPQFNDSDGRSL